MSNTEEELNRHRKDIDGYDQQIVELLQKRSISASKIGEIKKNSGDPIFRPDREKDIFKKLKNMNQGPLGDSQLAAIYREIISASISLEKGLRVGYLGPDGSFSNEAVRKRFGASVISHPLSSIPEVFKMVESGKLDYGVVPVENSSEGLVNSTLDQFLVSDLKIYSEIYIKIKMNLLGFEPDLKKIKKIYGLKIANSQCREWLSANLPDCEFIETSSTARAAQIVAEQKSGAAIASEIAAEIYNLNIIRDSIQDLADNTTRFLVIGRDQCAPTGEDKTSVLFSLTDKPGSLYLVLKPFYDHGINLTKIESRPTRRNPWEYNFFIDFYGHEKDEKIGELLNGLKQVTHFLKILGSYPVAEIIN